MVSDSTAEVVVQAKYKDGTMPIIRLKYAASLHILLFYFPIYITFYNAIPGSIMEGCKLYERILKMTLVTTVIKWRAE